jgi:hypothetical protein
VEVTPILPVVGEGGAQGQNFRGLAAAIFSFPDNLKDTMQCLYEFILILVVLYILGAVLRDVLYNDVPENNTKRTLTKWVSITVGLLAAMVIAFALREFCLMLPLLISTLASMVWLSFYPKHASIRGSVKSWYLVALARTKSVFRKKEAKA